MNLESLVVRTNFTALDWGIVGVYLVGTVFTGLYVNRYITNMTDYVVAGRAIKTYLGLATMIGTELGLVTLMYSAQKGFTGGFAAFHIALVAAIVTFLVGLTGFIVVPLRAIGVMTIPEFYERRFGRGVRILGGTILAFSGILNMGMFLKAGSLFMMGLTGMTSELHLKLVMSAMLGIVLLYTILGGMVSVVITDYMQFMVMAFGLLATSALAVHHLGWANIVDTVARLQGEAGFNPFHSEGFGTPYVLWMCFLGLVSSAVWQTSVMRATAAESTEVVRKLYMWSSVGFLIRFLIPYLWGICAFVYLASHPSLRPVFFPDQGPAASSTTLMAMPIFLAQVLPIGLIGLIAAGMLAAFMSTHDSYLLCWSSVLTQDVVAPCLGDKLSVRARLFLARTFILLIGLFLLLWGLWYPLGEDLWDYMAITGAVYFTGAFALLLAGIYWKGASTVGAYAALLCGFLAILGLKPLQSALGFSLGSEIVGLATLALALLAMLIGSLAFPDRGTSGTLASA